MPSSQTEALCVATRVLLRPLIRIFLRHGLPAKALFDLTKQVYVEVAKTEFGIGGKAATTSRIAILTGLTRKDVQRLLASPHPDDAATSEQYNRAARVIAGWLKDEDFSDHKGHPIPVPVEGERLAF